ncbi:MAG TPA: hypothetical protein ENN61_03785 [Bacteroidaceae bacterium]|nr:hypothetical protein [Bacteroidaceae bacterium]
MTKSLNNHGYLNFIHDYYRTLGFHEILVLYEGHVTHRVMKALTTLVDEQLELSNESELIRRRVYHVMVESLQNISRHAEPLHEHEEAFSCHGRGLLLLDKQDQCYNITTGNIIDNYQIDELSEFLAKLNHMDIDALDDMYKHQLREGLLSPKGGAGLGFIDIRRKTRNPIEYHFPRVNDRTSFFIFTSKISK